MGVSIRLKGLLRDNGMTIKSLAEKTGISVNTLYSITKRDSQRVDPVLLEKIATTLDCSTDYLLGRTETPNDMTLEHIEKVAKSVTPLPKKGFGTSFLQEYFATSNFIESLGYKDRIIDSDEDTEEIIGYDEDGAPEWQRIYKYCTVVDKRTGNTYTVLANEFEEIIKRITNYAKFEISEFLKTKKPDKK